MFFFVCYSHLDNDHALDERSTAQARVQMQVVAHLESEVRQLFLVLFMLRSYMSLDYPSTGD